MRMEVSCGSHLNVLKVNFEQRGKSDPAYRQTREGTDGATGEWSLAFLKTRAPSRVWIVL